VKHHFCPTCEQPYACQRGEPDCGSPELYDCMCCYQRRYRQELTSLAGALAARFAHGASAPIRVESGNIYPELVR
jgi:hypothetical protein